MMNCDSSGSFTVKVKSRAKLNLFLHVTGVCGAMHLIESLVVFLDLADKLTFSFNRKPLSVSFDTSAIGGVYIDPVDNLVYRAAVALAKKYGIEPSGEIFVEKVIPVGAGLGGGSSNAATTLRVLSTVYGIEYFGFDSALKEVALSLGSDVYVCLEERPSFVGGTGDAVVRVTLGDDWRDLHCVIAKARDSFLSSGGVYGKFDELGLTFAEPMGNMSLCVHDVAQGCTNSLYDPALLLDPGIGGVLEGISSCDGCLLSRMTGSGSVCFGLFSSEAAALRAEVILREQGFWSRYVSLFNFV